MLSHGVVAYCDRTFSRRPQILVNLPRQPYIGGQAVIEGVMMRSPKSFVVAVRRYAGGIAIREQAWDVLWPKVKFLRWPIFRGAVVLAESLHNGFSALKFSGDYALPPEEKANSKTSSVKTSTLLSFLLSVVASLGTSPEIEDNTPSKSPEANSDHPKSSAGTDGLLIAATALMVVFFIALPHLMTWGVSRAVGPSLDSSGWAFHLVDGLFRIAILVGYIWLLSKTRDAARLFEYHGAEHKAIWAYEQYEPLTVERSMLFSRQHPRCGTSFLFIVVGVAVVLHVALLPLLPRLHDNDLINQLLMVLVKVPMAFPIAGVAYELQRLSAKDTCPRWIRAMTLPGVWLQNITTQEPSSDQLEIALLSLDRALAREEGKPRSAVGITLYPSFAEAAGVKSAA